MTWLGIAIKDMKTLNEQEMHFRAWCRGIADRLDGKCVEECPYQETWLAEAWVKGFQS